MKKQEKTEKPLLPAEDKPFFSDKKNVVRLVLFFAALAIALFSIGYGVYRMGYQEPGPQEIVTDPDADLPYYNAGMGLVYTFTGSSGEIKTRKREVKEAYTALQKESFRLFDPENTYPGVVNLASLTKERGMPLAVSDALFSVLSDAWEKTARGEGYSVLGGAARAWRESLIYGYEQDRRDPVADRETAELLRELSALIRENSVGALAFDREKKTVTLTYSAAYTAFLDRLGGDVPALDLDLLYDAYRLQYVARGLEEAGFDAGYLTTASGLSLVLSGGSAAEYCLYAQKNGETLVAATLRGEPGTAASLFRVFPLYGEEEGYYTVKEGGATLFRHPYLTDFFAPQSLSAALSAAPAERIPDAVYQNIRLFSASGEAFSSRMSGAGSAVILLSDPLTVRSAAGEELTVNTQAGYTVKKP